MAVPTFKSFISEKEIEAVNKKKQEEWERVRKPDQPLGEENNGWLLDWFIFGSGWRCGLI